MANEDGQLTTTETNTENVSGEGQNEVTEDSGSSILTDEPIYQDQESNEGQEGKESSSDDSGSNESEKKDQVEGAPEEYAEFTAPEGVSLDNEMVEQFKSVAKELNISQGNAQKLMDIASNHFKKLSTDYQENVSKARQQWVDGIKKDPEFGGENFKGTVENAQRALNKYGSEDLKKLLSQTGLGDHGEFIKTFAKIGQAMSEDSFVDGGGDTVEKTAAEIMYPNQN